MKNFVDSWENLTSDRIILDIVEHCHIEFEDDIEIDYDNVSHQSIFNEKQCNIIDTEIENLLKNNALVEVDEVAGQFLSPIFLRSKKNGEYRMILNLKKFNKYVKYYHFKMNTFESAIKLINKGTYMASIDLRHAYYSVHIAPEHQIFLRFAWKNKIYQYTCLPFGLACAPRYFTKLMKPVYAKLRSLGFINVGYIDDSLLCGDTQDKCCKNACETKNLMENLGFIINKEKSILTPQKQIVFLGNLIDSEKMIVKLPIGKQETVTDECSKLCAKEKETIRNVAKVIGLIVSSFSAVEYGKLHYRELEHGKMLALKNVYGNYDASMFITSAMKKELEWWVINLHKQKREISHGTPDLILSCDASLQGWGGVTGDQKIGGRWTSDESEKHINFLELLAIFYTLKAFCKIVENKHVKILSDNSTAVSYINNMGGSKSIDCNCISKKIWFWCIENNTWLSCSHIAGKFNVEADEKSRVFNDKLEWQLNVNFLKISPKNGASQILICLHQD